MSPEVYKKIERESLQIFDNVFKKTPTKIKIAPIGINDSIINKVAMSRPSIFRYKLEFEDGFKTSFIGKWKSNNIISNGMKLLSDGNLATIFHLATNRKILSFNGSDSREIYIYQNIHKDLKEHLIDQYWQSGSKSGKHFLAMQEIKNASKAKPEDYRKVINIITDFHAKYYQDESCVESLKLNYYSTEDYKKSSKMLLNLWEHADNDSYYSKFQQEQIENFIKFIHFEHNLLPSNHLTLTHNDLSVRNTFKVEDKILIFDWELSCYQNPEHDIIELLASNLGTLSNDGIYKLIEYYFKIIEKKTGRKFNKKEKEQLLYFNVMEFCANKMTVLNIANKKLKLPYINQMLKNTSRLIELFGI